MIMRQAPAAAKNVRGWDCEVITSKYIFHVWLMLNLGCQGIRLPLLILR